MGSRRARDWEDETYSFDDEFDSEGSLVEGPFEYSLDDSDSEDEATTGPIFVQPAVAIPSVIYFTLLHLTYNVYFLRTESSFVGRVVSFFSSLF